MMARRMDVVRHALMLAACVAGVVGIGFMFQGTMDRNLVEVSRGVPVFLLGIWWSGRELGRSMIAARQRKSQS